MLPVLFISFSFNDTLTSCTMRSFHHEKPCFTRQDTINFHASNNLKNNILVSTLSHSRACNFAALRRCLPRLPAPHSYFASPSAAAYPLIAHPASYHSLIFFPASRSFIKFRLSRLLLTADLAILAIRTWPASYVALRYTFVLTSTLGFGKPVSAMFWFYAKRAAAPPTNEFCC